MKFFGFGSSTPPPPPPPARPPAPPVGKQPPGKPAAAPTRENSTAGADIVGKWREPGGSDTTEFRADGTVLETPANGPAIRGRYAIDGVKLKIRLDGVPDELSFAASVKGDKLEMKDPDGQVTHYQRIA
jgi:hypothetical protein